MSPKEKPSNPFYLLLVVVGVAFVITACAYFMMALREASPASPAAPHRLLALLKEYGFTALMVELGALAIATIGAIGTDDYWTRRSRRADSDIPDPLPSRREN